MEIKMKKYLFSQLNFTSILILLICFMYSNLGLAQSEKVRFVNKAGDTIIGYGRIIQTEYYEVLEFKENPLAKIKRYYVHKLKKFEFIDDYDYEHIRFGKSKKPLSVRVIYRGKVNLYAEDLPRFMMNQSNMSNQSYAPMFIGGNTIYYLKKDIDSVATHIKTNFAVGKSFRKTAMEYFKDCSELVEKLRKREFKRRHLLDVVYFYDKKCHK